MIKQPDGTRLDDQSGSAYQRFCACSVLHTGFAIPHNQGRRSVRLRRCVRGTSGGVETPAVTRQNRGERDVNK